MKAHRAEPCSPRANSVLRHSSLEWMLRHGGEVRDYKGQKTGYSDSGQRKAWFRNLRIGRASPIVPAAACAIAALATLHPCNVLSLSF